MTHYIQSRFCACDERIEKLLAGPWEFPDPHRRHAYFIVDTCGNAGKWWYQTVTERWVSECPDDAAPIPRRNEAGARAAVIAVLGAPVNTTKVSER